MIVRSVMKKKSSLYVYHVQAVDDDYKASTRPGLDHCVWSTGITPYFLLGGGGGIDDPAAGGWTQLDAVCERCTVQRIMSVIISCTSHSVAPYRRPART